MEHALTGRRFLGAAGAVALVTVLVGAWIGLRIGGARATLWVDDVATPLAALIACVLCFRARARHGGRMRLFWTLLGCATASWTLAEVVWGSYALILDVEVPVPSWADVGYLSAIPLAVAALVVHPATGGGGTRKARSVFDGLVVATALLFLSWTLVLGPLWRSAGGFPWVLDHGQGSSSKTEALSESARVQHLRYVRYNPFVMSGTIHPQGHRERIIEKLVQARLRTHGGVLLTGPKAVGKTTTARCFAASEVRLDQDRAALTAAQTDPRLVLDGEHPRLIDEYQLAAGVWNAVRGRIDDLGGKGLFLLTGSSTPESEEQSHTGARRIAAVQMRTMTLLERGLSSGAVSVGGLLDGSPAEAKPHRLSVTETIEALSIGGWPDNLTLTPADALEANADYLDMIVHTDVPRVDGARRDPDGVRRLLASYARNVATNASLRTIARAAEKPLGETTLHDYLHVLGRLFLIEDQPSWKPQLRSRVRLAATPKRHLADPSLAVAALGATPQRLLGPEIELAGFLFESQATHDLRVYAQPHRAEVRFYRDNKGLEIDAIVEAADGRWLAAEIKLGHHRVDEAARHLLALKEKLSPTTNATCGTLLVIVADSPTYTRPDGILVTSIASLGP